MPDSPFSSAEDIAASSTLHASFYREARWFEAARERIFPSGWQLLGDIDRVKTPGTAVPLTLLDGCVGEPVLLTRDSSDALHCLSNVCTHRGTILCEGETHATALRCRYHGRRFGLDGRFLSAPGFEGARNFPSPADHLPRVPHGTWGKLLFASASPAAPFDEWIAPVRERLGWLPLHEFVLEPALCRDYLVQANWALYCENYLEGFHVPYVHATLAAALDSDQYTTELFRWCSLQLGVASNPGDAFDLPAASPDRGRPVAAYYWWLWPNTMLNVYPWGLSANVVVPLAPDRTRVTYLGWVWKRDRLETGAGAALDRVEREDEAVVEQVQKGVRARLYGRGRYSPRWESGVKHFHDLLRNALS